MKKLGEKLRLFVSQYRKIFSLYNNVSIRNRFKILFDYRFYYKYKGLTIDEYYEFEFEKQNDDFKKSFLGINEQRYYLDYLNPVKYYILSRNKYLTHKILENTGIRKTKLYCYYQPECSIANSGEIASSIHDVIRILQSQGVTACVIKDTENSHGEGVVVVKDITYSDNDCLLHLYNGKCVQLSSMLGKHPLIFEGLIKQTSQIETLNSSSVNTIRFMTTLYPDGEARLVATFIKIGRKGSCVDNAGSGGNVDACIDPESGTLKFVIRYDGMRNTTDIACHPDTNVQLADVVIDNWDKIKNQVLNFQRAFPYAKAAGWDIAITDDGPVVVEVNDMWDRTGQLFIRRGWREEIRDCYRAWKKTDAKYVLYRQQNELKRKHLSVISDYEWR